MSTFIAVEKKERRIMYLNSSCDFETNRKINVKNKQINKHLMICVFTSEHTKCMRIARKHAPSNALTHTHTYIHTQERAIYKTTKRIVYETVLYTLFLSLSLSLSFFLFIVCIITVKYTSHTNRSSHRTICVLRCENFSHLI